MKSKLDNLPRYQTSELTIDAEFYNKVKLAILRNGHALRFSVNDLKNLEIILDHEYWVCVDSSLNDIPVFAWTDFQTQARDNLYKPIPAKLYSYHAHAELVIEKVTDQISETLDCLAKKIKA